MAQVVKNLKFQIHHFSYPCCLSWKFKVTHLNASAIILETMSDNCCYILMDPLAILFINYHRHTVNQVRGGNWSPLPSYNVVTDSFLILDTTSYNYPPVCINSGVLYISMRMYDSCGD